MYISGLLLFINTCNVTIELRIYLYLVYLVSYRCGFKMPERNIEEMFWNKMTNQAKMAVSQMTNQETAAERKNPKTINHCPS